MWLGRMEWILHFNQIFCNEKIKLIAKSNKFYILIIIKERGKEREREGERETETDRNRNKDRETERERGGIE